MTNRQWAWVFACVATVVLLGWYSPTAGSMMAAGLESLALRFNANYLAKARAVGTALASCLQSSPDLAWGAMMAIARRESSFEPAAANPRSSARGIYQVLAPYMADYGVSESTVMDLTANVQGVSAALQRNVIPVMQRMIPQCWDDYYFYTAALYAGLHEGAAGLRGICAAAGAEDATITVEDFLAAMDVPLAAIMRIVAADAGYWEDHREELLA